MGPIVQVKDVKKSYRLGKIAVPALRGVSFDVEEGEFLTIFGTSGSGRSTLLNLIGGLDRPDEGELRIDG
jgi:putative ABC transport system ATP-binding protein